MSEKDKWIEDSDILSIFPTCVWKVQLTSKFQQSVNNRILEVIHDPRPQTGVIRPPVTELTSQNADQVVVAVSNASIKAALRGSV